MRLSIEQTLQNLKLVVFDFDGVILESGHLKTEAFGELFPGHSEAVIDYHLQHQGVSRYKKFQWIYENLLDRSYSEDEGERLSAAFTKLVFEKILAAPFVPGTNAFLEVLKERQVPMTIASGTPQAELELIVAQRELEGYFGFVGGTPREKPELISVAMKKFGAEPTSTLMIGDATTDQGAAEIVGCRFLARADADTDWVNPDHCLVPNLLPICEFLSR